MANSFVPQAIVGWELLMVLGVGAAVIVGLATAVGRWLVSAAWRAAVWRIATISLFMLLAMEVTGVGPALIQLVGRQVLPSAAASGVSTKCVGEPGNSAVSVASAGISGPAGQSTWRRPTEGVATGDAGQTYFHPVAVTGRDSDATSSDARETGSELGQATAAAHSTVGRGQAGAATEDSVLRAQSPLAPPRSWWLAAAWMAGSVAVLSRILASRVAAWSFRRQCLKCEDVTIITQIARLQARFGMRQQLAILVSPRTVTPAVLGGWRPAVVLPADFPDDFSAEQRETILAHELSHLASHDPAWQAAALLVCSLLWWHPLVWWSRRQLRAASEALADEGSLVISNGPQILAEALVLLGKRLVEPAPRFGLSLGGGRFRSGLGQRVQRLLALSPVTRRVPLRARLAFAHCSLPVLMALAAILGTAWVPFSVPLTLGETTMSVFSNSWRSSLVATALWTMLGSAPAAVSADDQPAKSPPAAADREKIEQQVKSMREKVAQLEKDGKHDEAEQLKRQAYQLMSQLHGGSTSSRAASSGPEADKIRGQLREMVQKAEQLEKDGKRDEAEKLRHEIRELYSKTFARSSGTAGPAGPEREQLRQQWQALHEKIEKAKQEGNREDVERLMKEAEVLRSKLYGQSRDGSGYGRSQPGGDREARLQHLRAAAENLVAAGFEPEAQHVMQMIERMRPEGGDSRSRGDATRQRPEQNSSAYSSTRSERASSAPNTRGDVSAPVVQELRGQLDEMRREIRALRDQLNQSRSGDRR